jgi:DNA-binding PadR family transcriptional regulator
MLFTSRMETTLASGVNDVEQVPSRLSTTEYAVLGVIARRPSHGFAISRELRRDGEVGRVYAVSRPLVYRAVQRLAGVGMVEPVRTEPGEAGPQRVVYRATAPGRRALELWLMAPVDHVREIRLGFLLKLTLLLRSGRPPTELIERQRSALGPMLVALGEESEAVDPIESWRRHNAAAVDAYLKDLERIFGG